MYQSRKNPRLETKTFGNFSMAIKKDRSSEFPINVAIEKLTETNVAIYLDELPDYFTIGDSIEGVLQNEKGIVYQRFSGFVTWREKKRMGIRFHQEIQIPEQIIAWECSMAD